MRSESDRRSRRLASGALLPAVETGAPSVPTPIARWASEQMLEDMRGERP